MRFGCIQEAYFPPGTSIAERYAEMFEEAVLCEDAGFDFYGLSEQHFGLTPREPYPDQYFSQKSGAVSAPEVLFGYVAARTSTIRLRTTSTVLLSFNHPIRVAERVATLDVITDGRAELGTARSNNRATLEAFGVPPTETKAQWSESIEIITKALSQETFEHDGRFWTIPLQTLTPKPLQEPHPPIYVSAASEDSHRDAGERGIGVMTGGGALGWEHIQNCVDAYKDGLTRSNPLTELNASAGFLFLICHCAETMEKARAEAERPLRHQIGQTLGRGGRYEQLAATSADYEYLSRVEKVQEQLDDVDRALASIPYFVVGTPDFLIERLRKVQNMGYDEIIMRIDGMGHAANMRTIEMIGEYVIPELRDGSSSLEPASKPVDAAS